MEPVEETSDGAPALTDQELEAFTAPPPPDRPEPEDPPARGPLPGLEDLPDRGRAVEAAAADLEAPPIYVPPRGRGEPALERRSTPPDDVERRRRPASPFARPLPRVMAVANQKGGVGKTTTAVNLGACLADLGYRVLVVDLDPQGNASTGLGINIRDLHGSMYDVILHDLPIEDCVEATSVRNLFCAPSSLDLAGAEIELVPAFSRELRLRNALDEVRDDYDFVLIDCPPSLGLLTVNGLAAASEVVVPIQCEYYALEGLGQLLRNVNLVQKNLNPTLEVERHRPGHVRRPHEAGRPGGGGGAGALRRQGLQERGPAHRAAVGGPVVRAADHRVRSELPRRHRLQGAGQGGERWHAAAGWVGDSGH